MKKKRSGKKKSNQNNKPNNNGTTAENAITPDKHHNNSRPCSALAASISKEIFPSLPTSNNDTTDDTTDDTSTGKLLLTQQPLFAFMILRYMIEERKKIRDDEPGVADKESACQSTILATNKEELDTLLGSYIDSKEASNVLDNEAKKWGERDIESFVAYLAQKYDCQKKINKQNPLKLKDILPTISIESINSVLESVKCRSCRFSANSHLQSLLGVEKSRDNDTTKSKGAILSDQVMDTMDSESFNLELQPITQTGDDVKYLQIEATSKEHCSSSALSYPLSTQDIINLTRFIILPKKINTEDKIDDNANPGDDELTEIAKEAFDMVGKVEDLFKEAKVMCNEVILVSKKIAEDGIEEYGQYNDSIEETRKMLLECNRKCDVVMKKIGDLLLLLFKKTAFVGWSTERGDVLISFFHCLWDRYNTASDSLLRPTLFHRKKMSGVTIKGHSYRRQKRINFQQMVDDCHQNHLVDSYNSSKKECMSLQDLVMKKSTALSDLVNDLSLYIGICQADEPNPLVVLCVKEAYRKHDEHPKELVDVLKQEEEDLFVQLISARINLSQASTSMDTNGVQCMSEKFSKEVETLCRKIRKNASGLLETGIDFLNRAFKANEYSIENVKSGVDRMVSAFTGEMEDFETARKEAEEVCNLSMLLERSVWAVMQWLTVLCSRQCNESATKSLTLPPRLETWLDTTSGNSAAQADNLKLTCRGGNGEHRVSSIFSGLIYRWLEAQCAEWHAELIRDELLKSMEEPAVTASPRKGGRKSKKKKAATNSIKANVSSANGDYQAEEIVSSPVEVSESDQQKANDDTSSGSDEDEMIQSVESKNNISNTTCPEDEPEVQSTEKKIDIIQINEQISSSPTKSVDSSLVLNSSSDDMTEEKQYEQADLYESSDHQVEQLQFTHNDDDVESRPDNLEQIISSPSDAEEDSPCSDEDPLVVDSTSTSPDNHMHEQIDIHLTSIRSSSRVKEQLISSDDESVTGDTEQNARAIQALLTANEGVYNRCRGNIERGTNEKTTFAKANYTVVDAHHDEVTSMFQFMTYPDQCRLEFDTTPLSSVPFSLDFGDITIRLRHIGSVDSNESHFINYTALFENLVMLHDGETLSPYLDKLKHHLETVHNCLTKIDDWISTPSSNIKYLQQQFGEEKLQVSNKTIKHFCVEGSHQDYEVCFQCENRFDQHTVEERNVNGIEGGHRRLCPHPEDKDLPYFMCNKCDADSESQCPHYQVEESYILKKFKCVVSDSITEFVCSGTFDTTFDISNEQKRNQMNKLLEFIGMVSKGN